MIVTHKVKMDLMDRGVSPRVDVVQGDVCTRMLELSLFSGGREWEVPEGVTVAIRYCKPDKTKGYYDTMPDGTQAWTVQGNQISVMLIPQMLTADGPVMAQVEMIQRTKLLATFTIQIYVNANPAAGVIKSENYINWLQWVEDELDRYMKELTAIFDAYEAVVVAVDETLSVSGKAADAAAAGAAIRALEDSMSEKETQLQSIETALAQKTTILAVHPVGSVYLSAIAASPASLFGGSWEQLQDRFLLGAGTTYANGATGGAATHTLTESEIPRHNHPISTGAFGVVAEGTSMQRGWAENVRTEYTLSAGGGEAHNNMPPYLVVYMWKRVA